MQEMKIAEIKLSKNIRHSLGNINELVASIKQHGILEPLLIVDGELKSGFRRLEAAKALNMEKVPVRIFDLKNPEQAAEIQLVENIQRENLDPIEEGNAFKDYMEETKHDAEYLAEKMKDEGFWLVTRDKIPCRSFNTRMEAVKWLKKVLKQVLKDFEKQDKSDEYDYEINLKSIEINHYDNRKAYLGF